MGDPIPRRHSDRLPGESNRDALARLAGERDAALRDVERITAERDEAVAEVADLRDTIDRAFPWRVFVGQFDDDGVTAQVDQRFGHYADARAALDAMYVRWRSDTCGDCVAAAADDEAWLATLPDGAEFVGYVDGDDHLLIRSTLDDLSALRAERQANPAGEVPGAHSIAYLAAVVRERNERNGS